MKLPEINLPRFRLKGGGQGAGDGQVIGVPASKSTLLIVWLFAALVVLCAPFFFFYGLGNTAQVIDARIMQVVQAELAPEIAQRSIPEPMLKTVATLLGRGSLGLNYLTVRNADRVILVSNGDLENSLTWLPAGQARQWRGFLYRSSSFDRSAALRLSGEIVGYVDYGISTTAVLLALPLRLWLVFILAALAFFAFVRLFPVVVQYLQERYGQRPATAAKPKPQPRAAKIGKSRAEKAGVHELRLGDQLGIGYLSVDAKGEILSVNTNAARLLGFESRRLPGQVLEKLLVLEDGDNGSLNSPLADCLQGIRKTARKKAWLRRRDGKLVGVEMHAAGAVESDSSAASMLFWEVSEELTARRNDMERANLARELLQNIDEAVMLVDADGNILNANAAAARIFGKSMEQLKTGNVFAILPEPFSDKKLQPLTHAPGKVMHSDGTSKTATVTCIAHRWLAKPAYIVIVLTGDEPVQVQAASAPSLDALPAMAYRDQLTGLGNRRELNDRLITCFVPGQTATPCALLLIDVNNFKRINLEFGREAGDQCLALFAQTLSNVVSRADTVVRLGGDEFAVFLGGEATNEQSAENLAQRLLDSCSEPLRVADLELQIALDIGISVAPLDAQNANELLQHAEIALYISKVGAKREPTLYAPGMRFAPSSQLPAAQKLHRALAAGSKGGVELLLQPIQGAAQAVAAAMATIRWTTADGDVVENAALWKLAQETNLLEELLAWSLRRLSSEYTAWRDLGIAQVPAILIAPFEVLQLPALERLVAHLMARHHLPNGSLILSFSGPQAPQEFALPEGLRSALESELDNTQPTSADFLMLPSWVLNKLQDDPRAVEKAKTLVAYASKHRKMVIAGPVQNNEQNNALKALDIRLSYGPFAGAAQPPRPFGRTLAKRQTQPI